MYLSQKKKIIDLIKEFFKGKDIKKWMLSSIPRVTDPARHKTSRPAVANSKKKIL